MEMSSLCDEYKIKFETAGSKIRYTDRSKKNTTPQFDNTARVNWLCFQKGGGEINLIKIIMKGNGDKEVGLCERHLIRPGKVLVNLLKKAIEWRGIK